MDELRNQIKIRNLPERFADSPLQDFKGVLESWEPTARTSTGTADKPGRSFTIVVLKFTNVEVIESTEPYSFPVAEISIPFGSKGTRWGIFSDSLVQYLREKEELDDAVGKRLHLKRTPGHMLYDFRAQKETEQGAWEVMGVEGRGAGDNGAVAQQAANPEEAAREAFITHLQGADEKSANVAALRDTKVRGSQVQQGLLSRTLLPKLVELGVAVKDQDGKYQVEPALGAQWIVGAIG